MARQSTYIKDGEVQLGDKWLITDVVDGGTKNLTVTDLAQFYAETGTADPSKLGFRFNYAGTVADGATPVVNAGEYYVVGGPGFANVTRIIVSNTTATGRSFLPATRIIGNNDIKFTDITAPESDAYGFYHVRDVDQSTFVNATGLEVVNHGNNSSIGTFANITKMVLTPIGAPSDNSSRGVNIYDGTDAPLDIDPTVEYISGDLYFRTIIDPDTQFESVLFYGPYRNSAWGEPVDLTGQRGETGQRGPQGFQGIGIVSGTRAEPTSAIEMGTDTTFRVDLFNPDPDVDANPFTFTVPPGAAGDNVDPSAIRFTENGLDIDVTYEVTGEPVIDLGNFLAPTDGTNGRSITSVTFKETNDLVDTYNINYDSGDPDTFMVTNGSDGTNVTLSNITNGVKVSGVDTAGNPVSVDITSGTNGTNGTDVTLEAITDGVRVTGEDTAGDPVVVDIEDGSNVFVTPILNGVNVAGEDIAGDPISVDILNGTNGIGLNGNSVTAIDQVEALNSNVLTSVVTEGDPIFLRFTVTGPTYFWFEIPAGAMGTGSGSSDVDGIIVEGTSLAVSESGTPVTTHVVPIAQGTVTETTVAGQNYVDDGLGEKEDTISPTNRVDATNVGTGVVNNTEFNTLDGVTSSIQTQLDARVDTTGDEDIAGTKTFTSNPKGASPADDSNDTSLATTNWVRGHIGTGGAGATNLGIDNRDNDSLDVTSSNGDDATIPEATTTLAGLLTGTDKDKLDTVERNADVTPSWVPDTDPNYLTGVPVNVIDGQNLAAAKSTLGIPNTFAPTSAEMNVNANWNATSGDAEILNKPTALSDFDNDEDFIDLSAVPVRDVDFARTSVDDVQILSSGVLRLHLATSGAVGFNYGFNPSGASQTAGSLSAATFTVSGFDTAEFSARITSVNVPSGFTFSISGDEQSFTVTPNAGLTAANYTITPTVESTDLGTSVTEDHTDVPVIFQVQAATVPPAQSDYFYYGFTNVDEGPTAAAMTITDAEIADETSALDNGGFPPVTNVTRMQFNVGGEQQVIIGSDTKVTFVAIPSSISPIFHDETLNPMGELATFDFMNMAEIGTTEYTVYKQIIDANARYRINF